MIQAMKLQPKIQPAVTSYAPSPEQVPTVPFAGDFLNLSGQLTSRQERILSAIDLYLGNAPADYKEQMSIRSTMPALVRLFINPKRPAVSASRILEFMKQQSPHLGSVAGTQITADIGLLAAKGFIGTVNDKEAFQPGKTSLIYLTEAGEQALRDAKIYQP